MAAEGWDSPHLAVTLARLISQTSRTELLASAARVASVGPNFIFLSFFLSFFFFVFSGPHPQHMEIPRLGVESEL